MTTTAAEPLVRLLMTPGPTRVPARVLRAGARPMLHHRTLEFSRELADLLENLATVFGTKETVLPVHTTGRGAMEAALCNLLSPGDAIAACCNGRFGEMWPKLAEPHGLVVHRLATDWDRDVDVAEVERVLDAEPAIRAIAMAYGDTSTGVANDVEAVARVARARNVLVIVDGVSSIGGMPFRFDEWEIDAAITASQKCLMSAPGLSFVVVSERARVAMKDARLPKSYWNFDEIRREVTKPAPETPGTPPVHVVLQVAEALRMIHEEGLEMFQRRHAEMAAMVDRRITALGLTHQCASLRRRAHTVTAVAMPAGKSPDVVRRSLDEQGILVAEGLERYKNSAIRIGHMGDIRPDDVSRTLDALETTLAEA